MSAYGWIITEDKITEPGDGLPSREGWIGPSDIPGELEERLKKGEGQSFKMFDDDANHCYSGKYLGPDDEDMFGPLDDLGTPDAGCTYIKYRQPDGSYETL